MTCGLLTFRHFSFIHFCFEETYHMIDKCDSTIATWSENGDNFVVKNIEKFAGVSDDKQGVL